MDQEKTVAAVARRTLGVDAWMMLAMFAAYAYPLISSRSLVGILFAVLILYLLAEALLPPSLGYRVKLALLAFIIAAFILGSTLAQTYLRHIGPSYEHVHDGLIQIEEATKFLLAGKNPYGANYAETAMRYWPFQIGNTTANPALYHNAYLPFFFIFFAPFYLLLNATLGWFDGRLLFIPMFVGVLLLLGHWVQDRARRLALLAFVALDPFFVRFLVEGRNDIFILFWLVLSIELLRQRHEGLSLIVLGLACASKFTAWFLIPFYASYLFQPRADAVGIWLRANLRRVVLRLSLLAVTIAIMLLPFLLWNSGAFIDDVWRYPNGASAVAPYPIFGFGFNVLLQTVGVIPPDAVRSPFEWLQWLVGIPLLGVMLVRQLRVNTLPQMWLSYALLLAAMSFFGHVLNDNHIGFILTLFALAAFVEAEPKEATP